MERQAIENRLRGLRNGAGTAVLSLSLAACGANNGTETQKPTVLPTEKPTPTLIVSSTPEVSPTPIVTPKPEITPTPKPEITPTPKPEITPTPTPEASLLPVTEIFKTKYTTVSTSQLISSQTSLYEKYPQFDSVVSKTNIQQTLAHCDKKGTNADPQYINCMNLILQDYYLYSHTGNLDALNAAKVAYNYTLGLGGNKDWLDSQLSR
jgi:hypothetical protein